MAINCAVLSIPFAVLLYLGSSAALPTVQEGQWKDRCVYLMNVRFGEYLYTTSGPSNVTDHRKVATWRKTDGNAHLSTGDGQDQWIIHPDESAGGFTIRNVNSKEFLVANDDLRDTQRRNVFTTPELSPAAVWAIESIFYDYRHREPLTDVNRVRIQNKLYGEYLYAAANDLAIDDDRRSVFTWIDEQSEPAALWGPGEHDKPIWIIQEATC